MLKLFKKTRWLRQQIFSLNLKFDTSKSQETPKSVLEKNRITLFCKGFLYIFLDGPLLNFLDQ